MPAEAKLLPIFTDLATLEQAYYGDAFPDEFSKATGGYSTQTTGVFNPIFSAYAWANFNLEANIYALFPKYPWAWSGWRMYPTKAGDISLVSAGNNTNLGGVVENGKVLGAISPEVFEAFTKPKTCSYTINVSQVLENLNNISQDDAFGAIAHQKLYAADQFKENINKMIALDPQTETTVAADTLTRLNIESIERIVSSDKNQDAVKIAQTNLPAGAYDPWNQTTTIDRDSDTKFDSTVNAAGGGALGTSDVLSEGDITDTLADIRTASGKETNVLLGGQDTYSTLQKLYSGAYRLNDPVMTEGYSSIGVNGVETFRGTNVGISISKVYGIPFIPSKDTPKGYVPTTTADREANLYFLNTGYDDHNPSRPLLGYSVLMPPVLYEAGQSTPGFPVTIGSFSNFGVYETLADTVCTNFKAQGKIVNIVKTTAT